MKKLSYLFISLISIYLLLVFVVIPVDVLEYRPLLKIIKTIQSDSSLKTINTESNNKSTKQIDSNPLKNPYYGDLHVHTKYSFDAYVFGVTATPDDAYRYAKGEGIDHPLGYEMKLKKPLDFYSVTDHGFFMGMVEQYANMKSEISKKDFAVPFNDINRQSNLNVESASERIDLFSSVMRDTIINPYPSWHPKTLMAWLTRNTQLALRSFDYKIHKSAWSDIANTAEKHYVPGEFTTFVGYEYTTSTDTEGGNLHRNVIFAGSEIPIRPWTRIDSINPEDLWTWMDSLRLKGVDSISIPHNSNGSNGKMFEMETFESDAINKRYSNKRMRNEPIVEITQVKGTSDTHPLLSPDDEWADFEIMDRRVGSRPPTYSMPQGGYIRDAYLRGLSLEWSNQGNPYKFGLIGSSDTHTGGAGFEENNFWSKVGILDGTPEGRGSVPLGEQQLEDLRRLAEEANQPVLVQEFEQGTYNDTSFEQWGASGLAAVWAEENTRESIFSAFKRKETFATSGPRIAVRFFGGFDLDKLDLNSATLIKDAYEQGVSMGSDLNYSDDKIPSFLVWAVGDIDSAPLQRVQIIKGWIDMLSGQPKEKVYDIVCSDNLSPDPVTNRCPDNGAKVDINTCSISKDVGASELMTIWKDPDFDVNSKSFYYVRVLENPTCRWSSWDAIKAGYKPREDLQATIQERAWTSPIWFIPKPSEIEIIPLSGTLSIRGDLE